MKSQEGFTALNPEFILRMIKIGSKNAQLICLTQDYAQLSTSETKVIKSIPLETPQDNNSALKDCETHDNNETEMKTFTLNDPSFNLNYMKKLPTQTHHNMHRNQFEIANDGLLSTALYMSKKYKIPVLDYHQKFHDYMTSNPMYKGRTHPWIMVGRLSDCLVDEVLQEMVCDTKLEILVQHICTLELGAGLFIKKKQ